MCTFVVCVYVCLCLCEFMGTIDVGCYLSCCKIMSQCLIVFFIYTAELYISMEHFVSVDQLIVNHLSLCLSHYLSLSPAFMLIPIYVCRCWLFSSLSCPHLYLYLSPAASFFTLRSAAESVQVEVAIPTGRRNSFSNALQRIRL